MQVLIIIDQHGWAFDFAARGIQKYSNHKITIKRWNQISPLDINYDILFAMHVATGWNNIQDKTRRLLEAKIPQICIGIRSPGHTGYIKDVMKQYPSRRIGDIRWACVSNEIYNDMKRVYPSAQIYLTQNGVDTEIFQPLVVNPNRFQIGWAGNSSRPEKRLEILTALAFPLKIQSKWGEKFFIPDRSRDEMVQFYKSIDCYVAASKSEGMPQTILEAGASALPIVSTPAGDIPYFLDKDWLVPLNPATQIISEMNAKLKLLEKDIELRKAVGQRNLSETLKSWTWKDIVKQYDNMFEGK